jgi:hypothetical protein
LGLIPHGLPCLSKRKLEIAFQKNSRKYLEACLEDREF